MLGGQVRHQLLEIGRVCNVSLHESNFHIFYAILLGAPDSLLENLRLNKTKAYAVSTHLIKYFVLTRLCSAKDNLISHFVST